jgi:hypothetical protein
MQITIWDWDRTDNDDPMGEIKLKVREMRGNMWQKQQEGEDDAIAMTAAKDEMEKRQKLLNARLRLQAAQDPGAIVAAADDKPLLMLGNGEAEEPEEEQEQVEERDAGSAPLALPSQTPPRARRREDVWHTLQPVPPTPDHPDGCSHPQGQISVVPALYIYTQAYIQTYRHTLNMYVISVCRICMHIYIIRSRRLLH